jgi:protein gp37
MVASDAYWRNPIRWNQIAAEAGVRLRVFCASMADVFEGHPDLDQPRARLWKLIQETPSLDWLLLTKRPDVMLEWSRRHPWPANAWAGASVENHEVAEPRIRALLGVPAAIRFLSCEPLLSPINFLAMSTDPIGSGFALTDGLGRVDGEEPEIDWIIVGGESGPGARPMHPAWVRWIQGQAKAAGIAFHFKQWGEWAPRDRDDGRPFDTMALHNRDRLVAYDGTLHCTWGPAGPGAARMSRLGKKAAGRALDGVEHHAFPPGVIP